MLCSLEVVIGPLGEELMRCLVLGRLGDGVSAGNLCPSLAEGGSDGDGMSHCVSVLPASSADCGTVDGARGRRL